MFMVSDAGGNTKRVVSDDSASVAPDAEFTERKRRAEVSAENRKRDDVLVKRVLKGDRAAFQELFELYRSKALSVAFGILRSQEDAEDVVQESFVKAYLALPKYRAQAAFYTWLFRIVANMAIDYRRKIARRGGDPVELSEVILNSSEHSASEGVSTSTSGNGGASPFQILSTRQELEQLKKGLSELSEEHRAVITLREIEGFSYDEIASSVGVSKGTVMSRLHYARKYLQHSMKEDL